MNKRIKKKKDFAAFINFINDVNILEDDKDYALKIASDVFMESRCDDQCEKCNECEECLEECIEECLNKELTVAECIKIDLIAWQVYKDMLNDDRKTERIINLGKRKIQILLNSSEPNIWLLDCEKYGAGDKASILDQLSEDEQAKIVFHKHFHNY
jgi:hypothetical protein